MFRSTGTGFCMKFENGYEVSVQFGPGTYSANRDASLRDQSLGEKGSATAEVAVFAPDGKFCRLQEHDDVLGWCTPDRVAEIIEHVRKIQSPDVRDLVGV